MMSSLPPFVIFLVAGLLAVVVRGRLRSALLLATPVVSALTLIDLQPGTTVEVGIMGLELTLMRVDELSLLFGYLFHLGAFIGILYSLHVKDTLQQSTSVLYAGSAVGAAFAGDLITFFLFWELLAITSVFLIWASRTPSAIRAGIRYLVLQVGSGVTLLAGILFYAYGTGSIAFNEIGLDSPGDGSFSLVWA